MTDLAERDCIPCKGGVPPLEGPAIDEFLEQLDNGWQVVDQHHLRRTYRFPNFRDALAFTNRVGELSEEQGHHPDIYLTWGKVRLEIWTHKIDGLHESDFILAAKTDRLYEESRPRG